MLPEPALPGVFSPASPAVILTPRPDRLYVMARGLGSGGRIKENCGSLGASGSPEPTDLSINYGRNEYDSMPTRLGFMEF
jgi:hypothetical protein